MKNKIKRPISVWLAQILLLISVVLLLTQPFVGAFSAYSTARYYAIPDNYAAFLVLRVLLYGFVINAPVAIVFLWAFWGASKHKRYGRWMTVILLLLVSIACAISVFVDPYSPTDYYDSTNGLLSAGVLITKIGAIMFLLFVVFRIAFAERVTAFFNETSDPLNEPPPPPSFDA